MREPDDPWAEEESTVPAPRRVRGDGAITVTGLARRAWNPRPVEPPVISPEIREMPWPERSAEVIRYTALRTEHWLSGGGLLREWIRLNLWLAVILTVASFLVPPATAVLEGAAEWTALAATIVDNVTRAVLRLPPIVLGLATLFLLVKLAQRHWGRGRRARGMAPDGYDDYR
ncbi:hypothetical protein BH23VER1_BH23VER1_32590 [soil metagenome]